MVANGYDVEGLERPYFVSRGQWTVSGNVTIDAFTLLKPTTTLVSGAFGVSGIYFQRSLAAPYDDISGVSGAMGCTLRKIYSDTTGAAVGISPLFRRSMAVCHEGYVKMSYESGLLDGTPVTLTYGDLVSPTISGFRVYQETLQHDAAGSGLLTTGTEGARQQVLGWYADVASAMTGTRHRIKLMPKLVSGYHKL